MIKLLSKWEIQGNLFNLIKGIYKIRDNNIINGVILSTKIINKARFLTLTTFIQYCTGNFNLLQLKRNDVKSIKVRKEEIKLCEMRWLFTKKIKESKKLLQERLSKFTRLQDTKFHIKISCIIKHVII